MSDSPMKVALLVRRFAKRGGNERYAVELVQHLDRAGHAVQVLCQKSDPTLAAALTNTRVEHLGGPTFDPGLAMKSFAKRARRAVDDLRDRRAVDVVVGFGHAVRQDVARLGGGTHAGYLEAMRGAGRSRHPLLDRIAFGLERQRMAEGNTERFVVASRIVAEELTRHYGIPPERVDLVENGIDLTAFSAAEASAERARVREAWGVGDQDPVALFVGQDPLRKGLDLAAEAAAKAGARLVHVGPDRPTVAGVLDAGPTEDVAAAYRAADLLLAPSRYEPFGRTLLEAVACGCPVVASRRTGATEWLVKSEAMADLLVDAPEDIDGLGRAVERALEPAARAAVRAEAAHVLQGADLPRWARRVEAVLRDAALVRRSPDASGDRTDGPARRGRES